MGADLLFLSYGGSHVHMLKDVYRILSQKHSTAFLALTTAENVMQEFQLEHETLNRFVDDVSGLYKVLDRFGIHEEQFQHLYTGVGLSELESEFGYEQAAALFAEYGRTVFCPRVVARKILNHYQPKILVTSNLVRLSRAMIKEANQLGIQTVFLEDSFCTPSHPFEELHGETRAVVFPDIQIDYLISMSPDANESIKRNLARNYIINEPEFHALGNPNIEASLNVETVDDSVVPDEKYYLFLSNKLFREQITEFLVEFCKLNSETLLVIKIHPNESKEYYTEKFAEFDHVKVIAEKMSLVPLIKSSELVLATDTTAAFEAYLLGKKIFCLNPMHSEYLIELYVKRGISENVTTPEALAKRLVEFETESEEYVPQITLTRDSVNNIATFLDELVV